MSRNMFSRIRGDIYARSLTFRGLSAESQNFLWNIPWKGMPFRGMSKLSTDYTLGERHAIANYSASRQALPR
jgi:hypothetical protein